MFTEPRQKELQNRFATQKNKLVQTYIQQDIRVYGDKHQRYIVKRKQALQHIATHSEQYTRKTYTLSTQATIYLQANEHNPDQLQACFGNQLQQVLHAEFIAVIEQIAQLDAVIPNEHKKKITLPQTITDFANIGAEYNSAGYVAQATIFADFCHSALQYGSAVILGVCDGVENTANMVVHPKKTAINMARGIGIAAYYLAKILKQCGVCGIYGANEQNLGKLQSTITEITEPIITKLQSMSGPEIVRAATALVTETYLLGKCLTGVQKGCSRVGKTIRKFIKATKKPTMIHIPIPKLFTPEGFEIQLFKDGLELATAESLAPFEQVLEYMPQLMEYSKGIEAEMVELDKLFESVKFSFGEYKNIMLEGRARHLFDIEIHKKIKRSIITPKLYGFHHDYSSWLKNKGIIGIKKTAFGLAGTYKANVSINNVLVSEKTFFPSDWARKTVVKEIINSIKNPLETPRIEGDWVITLGKTKSDITIKTIIDLKNQRLISSYPIVKG